VLTHTKFAELGQKSGAAQRHSGAKAGAHKSREFRRVFRCGGMAEWSMAVVLKTDTSDPQHSRFSA
jgi:hypothetical protein